MGEKTLLHYRTTLPWDYDNEIGIELTTFCVHQWREDFSEIGFQTNET